MSNQTLTAAAFNEGVRQLAQSSRDLAARFGQQRTVDGQMRLIREELAEVLAATDDAHRVEELCDLVVVVCGWFAAKGMTPKDVSYHSLDAWVTKEIAEYYMGWVMDYIHLYPGKVFWHIFDVLRFIPNAAELFPAQVAHVVAKNAAKTADTHYLDSATGKITRKAGKECPRCGAVHPAGDFTSNVCPACEIEAAQS